MNREQIKQRIVEYLNEFGDLDPKQVNDDTALIGGQAAIKSRALVELLLALEEFAEDELDATFDWTSDAAMSESRSIFRSVGVLADHLHGLTSQG